MTAIACLALIALVLCLELRTSIRDDEERQYWAEFVRDNNLKARRKGR